jgi:uncharacterized protein (TIGR03000 family)
MISQRLLLTARLLTVVVINLGSTLPCVAHGGGGHGGGAGHALVHGGFPGCGFRGGLGYRGFYRYPGFFYGFPGFYGFGLGLGLGYGMGYGYGGYGYGYPYYPYAGGYPVYVTLGYGPPAAAACPVAGQGPAPGASAGSVPTAPIRLTDSDMLLSIRVPPNAVVRINGEKTNQTGPRREFLSSGLSPGRTYTFVVTAQWTEPDGQAVQLERRVQVQGGERRNVDFLMPLAAARSLR